MQSHLPIRPMLIGVLMCLGTPAAAAQIVEVAGADESDVATDRALRESGTRMIPAKPSATSRDALKTAAPQPRTPPAAAPASTADQVPAAAAQQAPASPTPEPSSSPVPSASPTPNKTASDPATAPTTDAAGSFRPYLRLDGGYLLSGGGDGAGRNGGFRATDIDNAGVAGIGIGLRINDNLRVDTTFSYRTAMDVSGNDGAGNAISGDVKSMSAMLNLYYDVAQAHDWLNTDRITPYLGAGIGGSHLDTGSLVTAGGPSEGGDDAINASYALMAGFATSISENISLDVGYRFIDLGGFEQNGNFSSGLNAAATKFDDLHAHEFKAGLRFQF